MKSKDIWAAAKQAEMEAISQRAHERDVADALNAVHLAIDEYYNGDREFAEAWLLKAMEANKQEGK